MKRINVIDFTRGLVMLIMALDHIRDLMHVNSISQNPTDLNTTTIGIFLTRWITHLCAPTFIFLSGTSAYLSIVAQNDKVASRKFLLTRGLWLIFLEFTVVSLGIWFDIRFGIAFFQVIATIGFGFILLAFMLRIPPKTLGIIGLVIIFGHDLLLGVNVGENPVIKFIASVLFAPSFNPITPNFTIFISYPIIQLFGIMLVGFAAGKLFDLPIAARKSILLKLGLASILLFVVIRFLNFYGDPVRWSSQKNVLFTFFSFINVNKYPPSLLYTLITVGIALVILSLADGWQNQFVSFVSVYGKVPLFYYIIHWYLVHSIMVVVVLLQGFSWNQLKFGGFTFGRPENGSSGVELPLVYLIWLGVIIAMYPICKWYGNYKRNHKENKLLRYL